MAGRPDRDALRIPYRFEFVMMTPIGVPAEWPPGAPRRDLDSFVIYEAFAPSA